MSNNADKETNFVVDIDNQSTATEIKNFMIGQVIGKDGKPNGIMQFINKIDETGHVVDITPEAIQRFKDMQLLIGMCIDNTTQIEGSIGMALHIYDIMGKITKLMGIEDSDKNLELVNNLNDSI